MRLRRWAEAVAVASLACAAASQQQSAWAQSEADASRIVADQVRDQGFECAAPARASREPGDSQPDEAAWLLECADAKYRVRIIPDQGAQITPVD